MTLSFFFSSRRRHTRCLSDWSSDVCSSDLINHIHYILDMLMPANVDLMKLKRPDRLKLMASLDVNSKQGKKAVAFLKQHNTVIDPTMALMEFQNRPADVPADKM